jgi:hypothetical protein
MTTPALDPDVRNLKGQADAFQVVALCCGLYCVVAVVWAMTDAGKQLLSSDGLGSSWLRWLVWWSLSAVLAAICGAAAGLGALVLRGRAEVFPRGDATAEPAG